MISPAIIPALTKVVPDVEWTITEENKFIKANGALLDLSGFRGEELAKFKDLDEDRKATLLEAIVYKAGFTVDVAGNDNDTDQAITLEDEVASPIDTSPLDIVEEKILETQSESVIEEEVTIEESDLKDEEVAAPVAEEVILESENIVNQPAKKSSKKKG